VTRDARHRDTARAREPQRRGLIATVFAIVTGVLGAMVMALALSVTLEWLGIAIGWWGSSHALELLSIERGYIEAIEQYPLTPLGPVAVSDWVTEYLDDGLSWLGLTTHPGLYALAAINAVKLVVLRAVLSLFALPGFLLIALAAFFEGLVARDIRRYTGGHESSYIFHKAKRWVIPSVVLTVTLYLMVPFSLPPAVVFAPTMLLAGVMVYVATSRFKKFV
jgi:hypothetical protein